MDLRVIVSETPTDADREAVVAPLREYNRRHAGDPRTEPVAILLADDQGNRVGGLWGKASFDWLFVEYLAVPDAYRGQDLGTALMAEAEKVARARGCIGIWLDTFDFQARGFYEKLGFAVFGTLEDQPVGHQHLFLRKRF